MAAATPVYVYVLKALNSWYHGDLSRAPLRTTPFGSQLCIGEWHAQRAAGACEVMREASKAFFSHADYATKARLDMLASNLLPHAGPGQ